MDKTAQWWGKVGAWEAERPCHVPMHIIRWERPLHVVGLSHTPPCCPTHGQEESGWKR